MYKVKEKIDKKHEEGMQKMIESAHLEHSKDEMTEVVEIGNYTFLSTKEGLPLLQYLKKITEMRERWDKERMKNFGKHLFES